MSNFSKKLIRMVTVSSYKQDKSKKKENFVLVPKTKSKNCGLINENQEHNEWLYPLVDE